HIRVPIVWSYSRYSCYCETPGRWSAARSVLASERFASAISAGQHGTTFGGGPLACRVALEYLTILEEEQLLENVNRVGAYLNQQLREVGFAYAGGVSVRGRGFIQGLQLDGPARPIVEQALSKGILFNSTQDTVIRFLPPFLLQEAHVDKGIRVLKKLMGKKRGRTQGASASQ
ncbi:MAG TPA: aminotransferase class III-fold pyridoxal phosphate-dependent enzyme, partial [Terriglobales bacterium]|nr:aminotransferase class III-fold pyridoxal phosphate-dependent enzyme [Terriglobales bacterium]